MGRRGPPPKPTRLKLLAGTWRPDRANPNEPQPRVERPPRPRGMLPEDRRHWDRLAGQLSELRVLTVADATALQLLAGALGEHERAQAIVAREGATYRAETKSGAVLLPHPAVKQAADAWRRAQRMLLEFGLSPASRTRVSAAPDSKPRNRFDLDTPAGPSSTKRRRA